jgi:2-phospho-L-lactate guanylyltransferase (CobY/MobA/RfbA family)
MECSARVDVAGALVMVHDDPLAVVVADLALLPYQQMMMMIMETKKRTRVCIEPK